MTREQFWEVEKMQATEVLEIINNAVRFMTEDELQEVLADYGIKEETAIEYGLIIRDTSFEGVFVDLDY